MFETFEHTADIGLRVRAADLNFLFAEAAQGMFSVMVGNLDQVRPVEAVRFALEEDEIDVLLRSWLAELLYAFHAGRLVFSAFEVDVRPGGLSAIARGEPIDTSRHALELEIKAVTWHGLKVEREEAGWLAEVIVDI
jgi:SHS2 domain-containing protein